MLSRAVVLLVPPSSRGFRATTVLGARRNKALSRLAIKRSVRDVQDGMKDLDLTSLQDEDADEPMVVKTTKMREALKQLNDPHSLEMDKIPLAKRGADEDMMTEEELEAFFDEDDDDDDDEDFDRELEELEHEDDKKRVRKMLTPGRAMKALTEDEKKSQKNAVPLNKEDKSRFNPDVINHRQQRVGLMLEGFIQGVIQDETDLCSGNTQVWITQVDMSPDLRRAVLHWDVTTLTHDKVSKSVEAKASRRLEKMTNFLRVRITQHLGLRYTPKLEFKRQDYGSFERRKKFDALMAAQGF
ncbi:unnamed protein product [Aphanomyces euteiches]|uniref:Ribosome-binding factor A n=1 Tax=Aphanomyces euteiches TaxID=100861 RepID=A0A6G0X3P5_9STRA|nr:hypothetical protein Ae201684_008759 [Aphanomyces euteiches]KAH9085632.1 hypothetical protein Ae201684P_005338 [Aphanomyces euteiches]